MHRHEKRERLHERFQQLRRKYGSLRGWTFKINGNKQRAGVCKHSKKRVEVANWLLNAPYEEALDTLLHEVAHALAPSGANHGPAWKRWARKVGAEPTRCYEDHLKQYRPKPNWYLVCENCDTALMSRYRRSDVSRKSHRHCDGDAGTLGFVKPDDWNGDIHSRIAHQGL